MSGRCRSFPIRQNVPFPAFSPDSNPKDNGFPHPAHLSLKQTEKGGIHEGARSGTALPHRQKQCLLAEQEG